MAAPETCSIAVCAISTKDLATAVRVVREAGSWGIIPLQWPNRGAFTAARDTANAFILHTGDDHDARSDELMRILVARPRSVPLIVFGSEPARGAAPTCWLPCPPGPTFLAALLDQLIAGGGTVQSGAPPAVLARQRRAGNGNMIIGNSPLIQQLIQALEQLAPSLTPVVITGESGSGKELVARALHDGGPRARGSFIAINCAAIPEHLFEAELFGYVRGAFTGAVQNHAGAIDAAHNGTLFLDEIGEMPLAMQAKLLRVLETGEIQRIGSTERKRVDFRLVSATNRNLEQEVKEGRFREDLYYRVRVYPLHVPPLRERPEDIAPIVNHHLTAIARREGRPALRLTAAALEKLINYHWPGNVRELVNLLERAVLLSRTNAIDAAQIILPQRPMPSPAAPSFTPYKQAKQRFEHEYYAHLMRTAGSNVSLAAKLSQKTRKEIYDALKRLGLDSTRAAAPDEELRGSTGARSRPTG